MKFKALNYLKNFLANHDYPIEDRDVFGVVTDAEPREEFVARVKCLLTEEEIKERKTSDRRREFRLDLTDCPADIMYQLWSDKNDRSYVRKLLDDVIAAHKKKVSVRMMENETFPKKLAELQKTLSLTDFEQDVLLVSLFLRCGLLVRQERSRRYEAKLVDFIAKCLDCTNTDVLAVVSEKGRLRRYRCLDEDLDFNLRLMHFLNGLDEEPFSRQYYSLQKDESLPWEFYGDLTTRHGEIIKDLIRTGKGDSPVNILFYGAPGTGKTSFARTLAAELGLSCYQISQDTSPGYSSGSKPKDRFGALQICKEQVDCAQSLIVVDEADEMLRGMGEFGLSSMFRASARSVGDKGLLNTVLDTIKTPTIWIANTSAEELDPSSRRRFDYSVKFEPLTSTQRLSIWKNSVKKQKLSKLFTEQQLTAFAERYAVSAGGIALTLKNVAQLKPAKKDVEALVDKLMAPHCDLLNISRSDEKQKPARDYSLEGLNIKGDLQLERIIEAVRNFQNGSDGDMDRPRMNLLLSGAPGTGKTEFVKYLGKVLNKRVSVKMGSDILSMYVGGTEQNIKQAFAEAASEKSILFLDEIDGLVQSRASAQRSWEVTQVNELLHQMENFGGVMIGATNFVENLDAAILRRFTFKLEFDWLTDDGKILFYERMFQSKLSPAEKKALVAIPNLAPGDFRTVRQSLYYLGGTITTADRLAALARESEAKSNNAFAARSKVGF